MKYLTIGVLAKNEDEVHYALNRVEFFKPLVENKSVFGFQVSVTDLRENYLAMKNFLENENLKDTNPFFREFEIEPFGLQIDFETLPDNVLMDILETIVFLLAKHISIELKTKTIVFFDNMEIPVGLFDNGRLVQTFENYSKGFFDRKEWQPKIMSV